MPLSSYRNNEGGDGASMLSSNRPQRLSVTSRRQSSTVLPYDSPMLELSCHNSTSISVSSSHSVREHKYAHDTPKQKDAKIAVGNTAEHSARRATLSKALTGLSSSPSVGATSANSSSCLRTSREASGVVDGRGRSMTSFLRSATSSDGARRIVRASAVFSSRRSTQQMRPQRSFTPASRAAAQSSQSTRSDQAGIASVPPELLALDPLPSPCLVPATSIIPPSHSAEAELAPSSAESVLSRTAGKIVKNGHDTHHSGVRVCGSVRPPSGASSKENIVAVRENPCGSNSEAITAPVVPMETTVSLRSVLGVNSPSSVVSCVTDPAPSISGLRRRRSVIRASSVASLPVGAEGVPVLAVRPLALPQAPSCSPSEQLVTAAGGAQESKESLVPTDPFFQSQHPDKQSTGVRSPSQPMPLSPALQTPPRSITPSEPEDHRLSVTAASQLTEQLSTAGVDAGAMCLLPGASLTQLSMDSPPTAERDEGVAHPSSAARSSSADTMRPSSTFSDEEPLAVRVTHLGASQAATGAVIVSQDNRSASAASTPLTSVDAEEPLAASREYMASDMEEEFAVGGSTPAQQAPMQHLEPPVLVGSILSTASDGLSPMQTDVLCAPPHIGTDELVEDVEMVRPQGGEEEDEQREESDFHEGSRNSRGSVDAFEGHHMTNSKGTITGPEDDAFSVLTVSTKAHSLTRKGLGAEEDTEGFLRESPRATARTGLVLITQDPSSRLEKQQELDVELLRIVSKTSLTHDVDLINVPGAPGEGEDPKDTVRDELVHRVTDITHDAEGEEESAIDSRSSKKELPSGATSPSTSSRASVARGSRVGPEGRPPLGGPGRVSATGTEGGGSNGSGLPQRGPGKTADLPPSAKAREASRPVNRSLQRTSSLEAGSVGSVAGMIRSTSRGRVVSEGGTGAKFTRVLSCGALSGTIQPLSAAARGVRTPAAAGEPRSSVRDSRRRSSSSNAMSGSRSDLTSCTALRRGEIVSGSLCGRGVPSPGKASSVPSEDLLPALFSAQEAAKTITVVFDLDETLCNNRSASGTILRPGAELLLNTLRGMCPSPRYKFVDTSNRHQSVSTRLYDEAMYRMGMVPLYRSRVAQRQAAYGHHPSSTLPTGNVTTPGANSSGVSCSTSSVGGCSTGEARPATAKDVNPLRLELVLWTASEESLARRAVRQIDPQSKIFDETIYRDPRWFRDLSYTKELSRLGRSMDRVVIVENSIDSVIRNRKNAILVASFVRNRLDRQLLLVREVLIDWVRGMKANLAEQQSTTHSVSVPFESAGCASNPDTVQHPPSESGNGLRNEGCETDADCKTAPNSTLPLAGGVEIESLGASMNSDSAAMRDKGTGPKSPGVDISLHGAASVPEAATPSYSSLSGSVIGSSSGHPPRPLSAMARRAPNIVDFLQHHRLILPFSNFLRFQLTDEVVMRLQRREPALFAAAFPPSPAPTEQAGFRVTRTVSSAPALRANRSSRGALISSSTSEETTTGEAPATVIPAGPASMALHTSSTGLVSPCEISAAKESAAESASQLQNPLKEIDGGGLPASIMEGFSARSSQGSRRSSVTPNGVIRRADNSQDLVRPKRSASLSANLFLKNSL